MKKLIDNKSQTLSQQQSLFLPHLKSKSMGPSSKLPANSSRRVAYKDAADIDKNSSQKKCIVNLEQIQKKSKISSSFKASLSHQRKKIISQYETIDLWKLKHNIIIQIPRKKQKGQSNEKYQRQNIQFKNNFQSLQQNRISGEKNRIKKQNVLSLSKLRSRNRSEVSKQIPEQVLIAKIDEYRLLKNDDKLQIALKKQSKTQKVTNLILKRYKQSIPIFERQSYSPLMNKQVHEIDNPTKWDAIYQYTDQQDHIF